MGSLAWFVFDHRTFVRNEKSTEKKIIPLRYAMTILIVVIGWVFFRSPGLR